MNKKIILVLSLVIILSSFLSVTVFIFISNPAKPDDAKMDQQAPEEVILVTDKPMSDTQSMESQDRTAVDSKFPLPVSVLPGDITILTSESMPREIAYTPEVGNGHIATVVQSDTIYINGLYNGANITSHRARIPSSSGYSIKSTTPCDLKKQYSLDLGRGVFSESFNGENGVSITLRTYAHRVLTLALVTELELTRNDVSIDVDVTVSLNRGEPSIDVDFNNDTVGVIHGRTKEAEYPELAPRTDFYMKSSKSLEGKISMTPGKKAQTFFAVTVIDVDKAAVLSQFEEAHIMFLGGKLLSSHVKEWNQVWEKGRIDVEGDINIARLNYACLYYILSSLPFNGNNETWPFIGLSPGGLAHGTDADYNGHVFWDQDTWMFPGIALLHPDLGRVMVETRTRTLKAAKLAAKRTGFQGARFPWESAFTGLETCPAEPYGDLEIHIIGDVAMMARQYWQLTGDREVMVNGSGAELIYETAKFWASRVIYNETKDRYRILGVMPPDEFHFPVNDSAYTNNIAAMNLRFANKLARELGQPENQTWAEIAEKMLLPYDAQLDYHPEYDGFTPRETTKQADVVLLNFPLMVPMNLSTKENDLRIYEDTTPLGPAPAMTWGMFLLGWLEQNNETKAAELFDRSILNVQQPFLVWSEYADGLGATNFLTGMGGYLQTVLFAYGGCRVYDDKLTFNPKLITRTTFVKFTGISYKGACLNLEYSTDSLTLTLTSVAEGYPGLDVKFEEGKEWEILKVGEAVQRKRQSFELRVR